MNMIKHIYKWFVTDSKFWVIAEFIAGVWDIFYKPHWGWKVFGVFLVFSAGSEAQRLLYAWKERDGST